MNVLQTALTLLLLLAQPSMQQGAPSLPTSRQNTPTRAIGISGERAAAASLVRAVTQLQWQLEQQRVYYAPVSPGPGPGSLPAGTVSTPTGSGGQSSAIGLPGQTEIDAQQRSIISERLLLASILLFFCLAMLLALAYALYCSRRQRILRTLHQDGCKSLEATAVLASKDGFYQQQQQQSPLSSSTFSADLRRAFSHAPTAFATQHKRDASDVQRASYWSRSTDRSSSVFPESIQGRLSEAVEVHDVDGYADDSRRDSAEHYATASRNVNPRHGEAAPAMPQDVHKPSSPQRRPLHAHFSPVPGQQHVPDHQSMTRILRSSPQFPSPPSQPPPQLPPVRLHGPFGQGFLKRSSSTATIDSGRRWKNDRFLARIDEAAASASHVSANDLARR